MAIVSGVNSSFVAVMSHARKALRSEVVHGVLVKYVGGGQYRLRLIDAHTGDERTIQLADERTVMHRRDIAGAIAEYAEKIGNDDIPVFMIQQNDSKREEDAYLEHKIVLVDKKTLQPRYTNDGYVQNLFNFTP